MTVNEQQLRQIYTEAGQEHVFTFYDSLSAQEQQDLLNQLSTIEPNHVNHLYQKAITGHKVENQPIEPLHEDTYDSVLDASPEKKLDWENKGFDLIANNQVAVLLLAGGQGTRLGSSDPKGCYDIGLPSKKSLFQIQAERIHRLQTVAQQRANVSTPVTIPWYIMTSGPTRAATEAFFEKMDYFGLSKDNIFFFDQGVLPCLTNDGKILLEGKGKVAVAPDGNGGVYPALRKQGALADMAKRNIKYIHAYCVDNCLVKVADPVFIGYCTEKKADCGAKVVPKAYATESVGVICLKSSRVSVVEYSEMTEEMNHRTRPNGKLVFDAANIVNHFYTLDFLNRMEQVEKELEYHIARKKIKHTDLQSGEQVSPATPNGMKLEAFVFDVFPFAEHMVVLQVERAEEFSPLKNAPGSKTDCPETSRRDIIAQHIRFIKAAGGIVNADESNLDSVNLEISPLVTYCGEGLEALAGKTVQPTHIESVETLRAFL
jgi:UDP-N-acetylglucosamine/UDP-N-acetylgalactosamine diphosphorylase